MRTPYNRNAALKEVDTVNIVLNQAEARVLGSLIEKDITTPDYYPLSLNSLINACNQKSNREPVMTLDEDTVRLALRNLSEKRLAGPISGADSRVIKYEHRLQEVFNFNRRETAILCVLLLRGPQTPGELRGRAERMHRFDDLSEVQSALQSLMQRELPLAKVLPRQPGTKEARYMHLLCGDVEPWEPAALSSASASGSEVDLERIEHLESEVASLRKEIADLKKQVEELQTGSTEERFRSD
jgi:uncharacterized protein YceH (UPF0502 family)